ncbi:MAG: arginine--tRNA ligase [Candidatus Nanohaloarchaea archaeon]
MKQIKQQLAEELSTVLEFEVGEEDIESPEGEHGDFAYPVMKAASTLGEPPRELAEDVSGEVELDIVEQVEVAGPGYLNFFLDREQFAEEVFEELERENMGVEQHDGKMLIEFSSPNVAKPMHVGHFRNNALGDSLQRILRFAGYDGTSENYLGDWGTQYGKLIYAFREYGSEEQFEEAPMEHMFDLYVRFHEEAEGDEEIEEKGREWAAKIEEGNEEARELWERFREASIEYHRKDYRRMGIEFDRWTGESKVVEEARDMVEGWLEEGELERDDDGSVFMEFEEHDLPGTVLLKADGSTLYITRDLYNLKKRNQEGFDHNLYVVGSEQELHFQQVFAAAEELGLDPEGSEHVSYGLLSLPEGSMSSRAGRIIRLEDAMDEAVERAEEKAAEKMEREVKNAEAIGIGALKYANLSVSRKKDIEFDWGRALSFEGDSGPYLQYSNVRAKSILEKADAEGQLRGELGDPEYRLLKKLGGFPEKVDAAAREREPAKVANYLSSLCEEFNSFYHDCPVIDAGEETRMRRLALVELFVDVTDQGLELLGIEPLEEM